MADQHPSPEFRVTDYDPFDPPLDPSEMQRFAPSPYDPISNNSSNPPQALYFPRLGINKERTSRFTEGAGNGAYTSIPSSHTRNMSGESPPKRSSSYGSSKPTAADNISLHSIGTGLARYKTDTATAMLVERRQNLVAQWKIHWWTPFVMAFLFVAGIMGALGHHFYYDHLDGQKADNQLMKVRYGTALAFFTKTMLVGAVVLSFRQRIWVSFRQKAMTIHAIDGLFAIIEDPTAFRKWEMWKNAKIATIMALATWTIPIAAILAPAALTTELTLRSQDTTCANVATLNFHQESTFNFRNTTAWPGGSMAFYNTTSTNITDGYFDFYDQPSKNAVRLVTTAAFNKRPFNSDDAAKQSCESGFNCTYIIAFDGPGYKCSELASGLGDTTGQAQLKSMNAPINFTSLAPQGTTIYSSDVNTGEYVRPQAPTTNDGVAQKPYPPDMGVLKAEPVVWIGYSQYTNQSWPDDSPYKNSKWEYVLVPKVFRCEHWNVQYEMAMTYIDGVQSYSVKNKTFTSPIINTTIAGDPTNPTITPATNYIRPETDAGVYKLVATYHALGYLFRQYLSGSITDDSTYPLTRTDASETRLINQQNHYPVPDLMDSVQSVYEDMLITLLSEPHLVAASTEGVGCTKFQSVNVHRYHEENLWIGYAIVVFVTAVALAIGYISIFQNGVASDTLFSRILVTTRNPTLDRLSVGACLGSDPFPVELKRTKLRFGVLLEDEYEGVGGAWEGGRGRRSTMGQRSPSLGVGTPRFGERGIEHCTFGAEGEIKRIEKYGAYAGLKHYRDEAFAFGGEEELPLLREAGEDEDEDDEMFYDVDE